MFSCAPASGPAGFVSSWGWASLMLAAVTACGGGHAPPAPTPDAAPRFDSSVPNEDAAAGDARVARPRDPRLPSADLELILPYEGPEQQIVLEVDARPGKLDVHLSIDTTGSFGGEIDALQADIVSSIAPAIRDRVADVTFGVSRFEDFPADPFGAEGDRPFGLLTALTTQSNRLASAVAALDSPLGSGGDLPEAGYEALFQIATGEGYRARSVAWVPRFEDSAPGGGTLGGVGFREEAMHVVVHVTDAPPHRAGDYDDVFPGTHGRVDAIDALRALDVRVVGIASDPGARPHLEDLALATGASIAPTGGSCATGVGGAAHEPSSGRCPLVFDARADGTGVSEAVVDGIVGLVDAIRYAEVYGRAPENRFGFVQAIVAAEALVSPGTEAPGLADLRPAGDGLDDTFTGVHVGTHLSFELRFRNTSVRAEDYEQVFLVPVEIVGDGDVLERRVVRVRVPLTRRDAGQADSGLAIDASSDGGAPDASPDAAMDAGVDASPDAATSDASADAALDAGA